MLRAALATTFVLHGLAMLAMAAFLLPMMPGGLTADDAERMRLIAMHPWSFRIGWLPWHLTALSDLFLAWAIWQMKAVPRIHAALVMGLTVVAVIADQASQLAWVTRGVDIARTGDLQAYLAFEGWAFPLTAMVAALLYTLAAIGWCICFAKAGVWSQRLTWLSWIIWPLFLFISVGPLVSSAISPRALAALNGAAFVSMELWFLLVFLRSKQ